MGNVRLAESPRPFPEARWRDPKIRWKKLDKVRNYPKIIRELWCRPENSPGNVDAEVLVTSEARKATSAPFQISGDYKDRATVNEYNAGGFRGPDQSLNKALAEFIHNLTFDSRLVEGSQ
jgi:hypothetical protein